ncbi:MAG: polyprenyl diphosphate synthase [Chloroflexota bacterium]
MFNLRKDKSKAITNDVHTLDDEYPPLQNPPQHVGIIMDGNGRWAKANGKIRLEGHRAGPEALRRTVENSVEFGVKMLTIYAFSTENWKRPPLEVTGLMRLLEDVIDKELDDLNKNGVQIRHLGQLEKLNPAIRNKVLHALDTTKNNDRLILNVAFNYGGRDEIVQAVKHMMQDNVKPDEVTEDLLSHYMYTGDSPDPDLIIRTSGEFRTSNFLIWQAAYAEYYITPTYWPDFDKAEYYKALQVFNQRDRRYGGRDK